MDTATRILNKSLPVFQRCNSFNFEIGILHYYYLSLEDELKLHWSIGSDFGIED